MSSSFDRDIETNKELLDEEVVSKVKIQLDHSVSSQVDIKNSIVPSDDSFLDLTGVVESESAELLVPSIKPFEKAIEYYISKSDTNSSDDDDDERTQNETSTCSSTSSVRHGTPRAAAKYISISNSIFEGDREKKEVETLFFIRM